MSRYLASLGATARAQSSSNHLIHGLIRGRCARNASLWHHDRAHQLGVFVLLLRFAFFPYLNSFHNVFYFSFLCVLCSGVVGVIWFVIWWFYSYERPANCNTITEQERIYIEEAIGETSSLATKVSSR